MDIAVVDDMKNEAGAVKDLLDEYMALNQLESDITMFLSGEDFLEDFRPLRYTAVFLDIYMDGMTGIEAAEKIRAADSGIIIIFLTTSEEHRADAFHCHAYDYIIKPVTRESLFRTMDDILKIRTQLDTKKLIFSCRRRSYSMPYADIVFIRTESTGSNYLELMDRMGNSYRIRMTFSSVCEALSDDNRFLAVQAGTLVNMEYIVQMKDRCCIMENGERLPYSVKKEKEIRRTWQNYMFDYIRSQSMKG